MQKNEIEQAKNDNLCPICGKPVNSNEMVILDNGNPGCKECANNEK